MKRSLKLTFMALAFLVTSSCLVTRSELGEQDQSRVYGKKNADNQKAAPRDQLSEKAPAVVVDERDETIRTFNGRIETLEAEIAKLQKEKAEMQTADTQKIQTLQEALTKMEAQIQKLEAEAQAAAAQPKPALQSSDAAAAAKGGAKAAAKPTGSYDIAMDHFSKKEWKKSILGFQKYIDESPKGKQVADAKYRIGVCFQELGMKEEAMAFYEEVVANYSKQEAGKKAKIRLASLKKK